MLTKRASAFPKGIFILFTSTYPPEQSGIPATFGKIIRDYAYNEAKSDGYLLPVRIIRMIVAHALSPETGLGDLGYVNKRSLSAWETESIARAVIQDMTVSHRASANKAIVFVPDIASGFSIVAAIEHLQLGDAGRANDDLAVRAHLISSWTDSETQESSLLDFRNSDVSSVAVMTTARVIGLDFPEVDRCYVTRPIPPSICNAIVSIVGRLHLGKTEGVVVDFGENSWPILASE
jgi:superfamily II DNA or RNA helicase